MAIIAGLSLLPALIVRLLAVEAVEAANSVDAASPVWALAIITRLCITLAVIRPTCPLRYIPGYFRVFSQLRACSPVVVGILVFTTLFINFCTLQVLGEASALTTLAVYSTLGCFISCLPLSQLLPHVGLGGLRSHLPGADKKKAESGTTHTCIADSSCQSASPCAGKNASTASSAVQAILAMAGRPRYAPSPAAPGAPTSKPQPPAAETKTIVIARILPSRGKGAETPATGAKHAQSPPQSKASSSSASPGAVKARGGIPNSAASGHGALPSPQPQPAPSGAACSSPPRLRLSSLKAPSGLSRCTIAEDAPFPPPNTTTVMELTERVVRLGSRRLRYRGFRPSDRWEAVNHFHHVHQSYAQLHQYQQQQHYPLQHLYGTAGPQDDATNLLPMMQSCPSAIGYEAGPAPQQLRAFASAPPHAATHNGMHAGPTSSPWPYSGPGSQQVHALSAMPTAEHSPQQPHAASFAPNTPPHQQLPNGRVLNAPCATADSAYAALAAQQQQQQLYHQQLLQQQQHLQQQQLHYLQQQQQLQQEFGVRKDQHHALSGAPVMAPGAAMQPHPHPHHHPRVAAAPGHHVSLSIKVPWAEPSSLPRTGLLESLNEALSTGSGYMVVGASVRHGCVLLKLDLMGLGTGGTRQRQQQPEWMAAAATAAEEEAMAEADGQFALAPGTPTASAGAGGGVREAQGGGEGAEVDALLSTVLGQLGLGAPVEGAEGHVLACVGGRSMELSYNHETAAWGAIPCSGYDGGWQLEGPAAATEVAEDADTDSGSHSDQVVDGIADQLPADGGRCHGSREGSGSGSSSRSLAVAPCPGVQLRAAQMCVVLPATAPRRASASSAAAAACDEVVVTLLMETGGCFALGWELAAALLPRRASGTVEKREADKGGRGAGEPFQLVATCLGRSLVVEVRQVLTPSSSASAAGVAAVADQRAAAVTVQAVVQGAGAALAAAGVQLGLLSLELWCGARQLTRVPVLLVREEEVRSAPAPAPAGPGMHHELMLGEEESGGGRCSSWEPRRLAEELVALAVSAFEDVQGGISGNSSGAPTAPSIEDMEAAHQLVQDLALFHVYVTAQEAGTGRNGPQRDALQQNASFPSSSCASAPGLLPGSLDLTAQMVALLGRTDPQRRQAMLQTGADLLSYAVLLGMPYTAAAVRRGLMALGCDLAQAERLACCVGHVSSAAAAGEGGSTGDGIQSVEEQAWGTMVDDDEAGALRLGADEAGPEDPMAGVPLVPRAVASRDLRVLRLLATWAQQDGLRLGHDAWLQEGAAGSQISGTDGATADRQAAETAAAVLAGDPDSPTTSTPFNIQVRDLIAAMQGRRPAGPATPAPTTPAASSQPAATSTPSARAARPAAGPRLGPGPLVAAWQRLSVVVSLGRRSRPVSCLLGYADPEQEDAYRRFTAPDNARVAAYWVPVMCAALAAALLRRLRGTASGDWTELPASLVFAGPYVPLALSMVFRPRTFHHSLRRWWVVCSVGRLAVKPLCASGLLPMPPSLVAYTRSGVTLLTDTLLPGLCERTVGAGDLSLRVLDLVTYTYFLLSARVLESTAACVAYALARLFLSLCASVLVEHHLRRRFEARAACQGAHVAGARECSHSLAKGSPHGGAGARRVVRGL